MQFQTAPALPSTLLRYFVGAAALCLFAARCAAAEPPPNHVVNITMLANDPVAREIFAVIQRAYQRLGMTAVAEETPAERGLFNANRGAVFGDLVRMEGLGQRYPNLVRIPVPVSYFDAVVFSYGRPDVTAWQDLKPYHVCIRHGIKAIESALAGSPGIETAYSYENAFDMLKAKRCDYAVLPFFAWTEVPRADLAGLRSQQRPLQRWTLYHYVNKAHADLVPALTAEIQKLRDDGSLQKVMDDSYRAGEVARRANEVKAGP